MESIRGFSELGLGLSAPAVTIGNFDGVHRGHQQVILSAVREARRRGAPAVVCTFDPHTLAVVRPDRAPRSLQTLEQRLAAFATLGVDVAVVIPFDRELAAVSHEEFVHGFLVGELAVGSLHVSETFSFGHDREGSTAYLKQASRWGHYELFPVAALEVDGEIVSSTRIRRLIESGRIEEANELLGRPYALHGAVVAGAGRGRGMNAPTANLDVANGCIPGRGVYVAEARLGADRHAAVANIGTRPTFESGQLVVVEAHLLCVDEDLYGRTLELALHRRLRGERRFSSSAELVAQIREDVRQTRLFFAEGLETPARKPAG